MAAEKDQGTSGAGSAGGAGGNSSKQHRGATRNKRDGVRKPYSKDGKGLKKEAIKSAVSKVMAADPNKPHTVLGANEDATKEELIKRYRNLILKTNPDEAADPRAGQAYERVKKAAEDLQFTEAEMEFNDGSADMDAEDLDAMDTSGADDQKPEVFAGTLVPIYTNAKPLLHAILMDTDIESLISKLENLNGQIKNACKEENVSAAGTEKALIDIPALTTQFKAAKPLYFTWHKTSGAVGRADLEKINGELKKLIQEHNYPADWEIDLTKPDSKKWGAGKTQEGDKILAYRALRLGDLYYVEKGATKGGSICVVKNSAEVGYMEAQAYKAYENRVNAGAGKRKYRRDDHPSYAGIIHVACKPAHSRMLPKDGRGPRNPLTDVCCTFDGKETWMTCSDLAAMIGRPSMQLYVRSYYSERGVECPWDIDPKRILEDVTGKKRSTDSNSSSPLSENVSSQNASINARLENLEASVEGINTKFDESIPIIVKTATEAATKAATAAATDAAAKAASEAAVKAVMSYFQQHGFQFPQSTESQRGQQRPRDFPSPSPSVATTIEEEL